MKKLLKFKNSLIMMLGVLLCLSGLISCSITIDLSTDNNGQVIENSNDTIIHLPKIQLLIVVISLLIIFQHILVTIILF